uniref:C3H1-type domain-containing protein n=1 Tax=Aegilops tauschii TaxID=37682 RepID=M8CE02_AEGTA
MDGDEDSLHFDIEDYLDAAGAGTGSSVWSFEAPIPAAGGPSHGPDSGSIQMDGDEGSLRFDLDAVGAGSGSDEEIPECIIEPATDTVSDTDTAPICSGYVPPEYQGIDDPKQCRYFMDTRPVRFGYGPAQLRDGGSCCNLRAPLWSHVTVFSVGFCLNGPNCKCMHVKLPGPPPVQEVLQKFQQTNAYNYGSSSTTYQPRDNNCKQKAKPQVQHESVLENQNLAVNATLVAQQPAAQHVQTENPPPHLQQQQNAQVQGVHNGSSIQKLPQLQAHFHKGNQGGSF